MIDSLVLKLLDISITYSLPELFSKSTIFHIETFRQYKKAPIARRRLVLEFYFMSYVQ